jgi:hypothetical protein
MTDTVTEAADLRPEVQVLETLVVIDGVEQQHRHCCPQPYTIVWDEPSDSPRFDKVVVVDMYCGIGGMHSALHMNTDAFYIALAVAEDTATAKAYTNTWPHTHCVTTLHNARLNDVQDNVHKIDPDFMVFTLPATSTGNNKSSTIAQDSMHVLVENKIPVALIVCLAPKELGMHDWVQAERYLHKNGYDTYVATESVNRLGVASVHKLSYILVVHVCMDTRDALHRYGDYINNEMRQQSQITF